MEDSQKPMPYVGPVELRYESRIGFASALVMGDEPLSAVILMKDIGFGRRTEDRAGHRQPALPEHCFIHREATRRTGELRGRFRGSLIRPMPCGRGRPANPWLSVPDRAVAGAASGRPGTLERIDPDTDFQHPDQVARSGASCGGDRLARKDRRGSAAHGGPPRFPLRHGRHLAGARREGGAPGHPGLTHAAARLKSRQ